MSKHCEVCNRSYPDDLDACPHCAEVVELDEADVVELVDDAPEITADAVHPQTGPAGAGDSAVDLGLPAVPADPNGSGSGGSSISVIEWASLVEEAPPAPEPAAARSDESAAPPPAAEPTPATAGADEEDALGSDLDAVRNIFAGDPSASFVRRGAAEAPPAAKDDDSALDLLAPEAPSRVDLGPTAAPGGSHSDIDLGPAPAGPASHSEIDIGGAPAGAGSASRQGAAGPGSHSEVDLGPTPVGPGSHSEIEIGAMPPEGGSASRQPVEPGAVEGAGSGIDLASAELEQEIVADAGPGPASESSIDLGAPPAPEQPSEVLEVAEVVDSGVDLAGPVSGLARPISDAGIDLGGGEAVGTGDPGPHASIERGAPEASESGRDLIAEEVESGTDLPADAFEVAGDSKVGLAADAVDEIIADESGTALAAGQLPSEAEEVDLTEPPAPAVESSAVDLGGSATFPAAPPEAASGADRLEAAPSDAAGESAEPKKPASIHGEDEEMVSPSEVDLGRRHGARRESGDYFDESSALAHAPVRPPGDEAVDEDEDVLAGASDEFSAAADEEPAADEPEEEEAPARAAAPMEKRRSAAGAWVGGALLGGVVTAGALAVLWYLGVLPGNAAGPAPATHGPANVQGPAAAPPMTLAEKMALIRSGDFERAQKAGVETADEAKADEVAARGEYRVLNYFRQQSANNQPVKADDESLKKGLDDLEKSKGQSEDALFFLGVTKEAVGDAAGAQKVYQEGAERYKDDPAKRQRFEDALNRLAANAPNRPGPMGRAAPADAVLLALLIALDAPPAPGPEKQPQATPAEAGSEFWKAMKLAREDKFAEAEKALDQAAELHLKRRFSVLGQAQNPNSDPTEEIFLRSCEGLKAYWALEDKLHASTLPVVKNAKGPAAALDALLAQDKDLTAKAAGAAAEADALKTQLDTAKKNAEDAKATADATKKDLDAARKAAETAKADIDAARKDAAASAKKAADLEDKAAKLTADLKAATDAAAKKDETVKGVAAALASAKYVKPDAGDAAVLTAVKDLIQSADSKEAGKTIGALRQEVAELNDRAAALKDALQQRWPPEQMLTFWMPLLRERGRKDLAADAVQDADRVLKADKAPPAVKAHAHAVKGLALLDEEKYGEAKAELAQAKAALAKDDGEWVLETESALKEASDPSAWFAARAEALHKEGRDEQAAAMLARAMGLAGSANGGLIARRGTWRLDAALARGQGRVSADDPDVAAARKDAEEAKKSGAAEGFYLGGRVNEALGRWDAATEDYRQALKAHPALDAEGATYRAALARVLVQPRAAAPVKVSRVEGTPGLSLLAALMTVTVEAGELPGQLDPATQEAVRLADEILAAKEGDVPFEARAQAYAIKHQWTLALRTYAEGLRPSLSPEHGAGLLAIIEGHPALGRPTGPAGGDPLAAARHYDAGLNLFTDRQYAKAEKEFRTAAENDGLDARYRYFLGLARWMQGDRDAYEDFEQGARLERQGRPPRAAVSAALERVQGAPRAALNEVRDRPR